MNSRQPWVMKWDCLSKQKKKKKYTLIKDVFVNIKVSKNPSFNYKKKQRSLIRVSVMSRGQWWCSETPWIGQQWELIDQMVITSSWIVTSVLQLMCYFNPSQARSQLALIVLQIVGWRCWWWSCLYLQIILYLYYIISSIYIIVVYLQWTGILFGKIIYIILQI